MLTQNKQTLVIAAIAARAYVKAAVAAGFEVIALDCFADVDTKKLAKSVHQIPLLNGRLDSEYLLDTVKRIASQNILGFCYGAGFELQPVVLRHINQYIQVIGNTEDVVRHCKDPSRFFETCDALAIMHPEVVLGLLNSTGEWLKKTTGSSGGAHVKRLEEGGCEPPEGAYFQQMQTGKSISCLFLANGHDVQVVGFSEQWLDGNVIEPYRYGGAVMQARLSGLARERFVSYIAQLTQELDLLGLNSCDAICDGDNVYVLEINPRLSATVDLYGSVYPDLIAKHVNASQKKVLGSLTCPDDIQTSRAHQVVYAKGDVTIEGGISWPAWVADIPEAGNVFKKGMPVCTVLAQASTGQQAKSLVQARVATLNNEFLN